MRAEDFLSSTDLSKKTSVTIDMLEKGTTEKLIILRNNAPKAILLSIDAYEALMEEIEDLRLAALALARLQTFEIEAAVDHKKMMKKFDL